MTIRDALALLTPREEKVVRMLHGIAATARTPKEVAIHFDVTRERIYQIHKKAAAQLRQFYESGELDMATVPDTLRDKIT